MKEYQKEFEQARQEYQEIPVPEALAGRVQEGIRQGMAGYRKQKVQRMIRRSAGAAAACCAVLVGALNLLPSVAAAAAEVPVLGGLFQVLTFTRYDNTSADGIHYSVSVPKLAANEQNALPEQINAVIQEKVDAHLEKARQDWADYKDAFFATGGTAEEWGDREMDVIADYEVKSQTGTQVSFVVTLAEGWVSAMEERYYYNLDVAEERVLTLADVLGPDWIQTCNASIQAGIAAQTDADGFSYFFAPEDGGFVTVDETTPFYIRADGMPVVVFPKYSIAAGAAGFPEFPIGQPTK